MLADPAIRAAGPQLESALNTALVVLLHTNPRNAFGSETR